MTRLPTWFAAAVACCAMTATAAEAQDGMGRRISRFDLGLYAGGAFTTDWFEGRTVTVANGGVTENDDEEGFRPGLGGAFGATATFWFTPGLGVRAHGAYLPMQPPSQHMGFFETGGRENFTLNTYVYDLNLAFRPFISRMGGSPFMSSMYLFLGGGGLTVDVTGEDRVACEPNGQVQGACLPLEPRLASVAQGNGGIGLDVFPLGGPLALFGELGVHVYDSPVHVGDDWVPPVRVPTGQIARVAEDRYGVTTRLVLGLKAMFGNFWTPPPVVVTPPPPPPMPPPPPPPPPPVVETRDIQVCVVENGMLRNMTVQYNTRTNDTTMNGQRFSPSMTGYAAGATWFINNEPVTMMGRRYVKYGLPRVLGVNEVTRVGEYQGVSVFAETGATGAPEVLYVPVRPGCEFQPYQTEVKAGAVRGD